MDTTFSKRRAYRILDVCAITGLGRTTVYGAIKSGDLVARKLGRSTLVLATDLEEFLRRLPVSVKNGNGQSVNTDAPASAGRSDV